MQSSQPPEASRGELVDVLGPAAAGGVVEPSQLSTRPVKSPGYWKQTWRRFRKNKLAVLALLCVTFLAVVAVFSPAIVGTKPIVVQYKGELYFPALGYFNDAWENPVFQADRFRGRYRAKLPEKDPDGWAVWPLVFQDPLRRVKADEYPGRPANPARDRGRPSSLNFFGTNSDGIDVFAQMVHGTRTALLVGFVSMGIAGFIGITIGATAGYFGGWIDVLLSRLIEVVICIPSLVLILALIATVERQQTWHIMAIIGITGWTSIARLTRGEFLRLRDLEFVQAARVTGISTPRIIFRHILPNAIAPALVPITFGIAGAILLESSLSYLGFGPPGVPSWGKMLSEGRSNQQMYWLILYPGLAIFLAVLCYNLVGEGLQEATDPRLRERD